MSKSDFSSQHDDRIANHAQVKTDGDEPQSLSNYWQWLRTTALRLFAIFSVLLIFLAVMTGGAAQYTSRSQFCMSCHIMQPYYDSWAESPHKDVNCIKCHFPPGAGEKIRGKLQGLVQLIKYVTATAGPRLSAEIPDESCLRCHDTRLLAGRVDFHGIPFDHRPHLTQERRGKRLRCTSCHNQIVQGAHMTVSTSTCFLCHFKGGVVNQGLGACTRCHSIPEKSFDLGGGVNFNHELAYERGVDCANCHSDIIRGTGEVPKERCAECHNRADDLKKAEDHVMLHQVHVTDHKVDCLDCHLEIVHSLDSKKLEHAASNCQACHRNQHIEQVDLLKGIGGKSVGVQHGGMGTVGISCTSCHKNKETLDSGTVLWKASIAVCTQCHDDAVKDRLLARQEQFKGSLTKIDADLARASEALKSAKLPEAKVGDLTHRLSDLASDLKFLRVGNSIHNTHYADSLLRVLLEKLREICRELNIAEPAVELPQEFDPGKRRRS
jgi:predicted CXXCH cytochrome family protein